MMGLRFFKRALPIRNDQHMETSPLQKRREAICDGRVIVSKEEGGSVG